MGDALKPCRRCEEPDPQQMVMPMRGGVGELHSYACLRCGYSPGWFESDEVARRFWSRAPSPLPSVEAVAQLRGIAAELLALREAEGGAECEITTNARRVLALIGGEK